MDEIRIGVAGLGHRSHMWLRHLLNIPGYRITAISDWIEPLHEKFLAGIPYRDEVACFTDYEEFIASDKIDAVALCVRRMDQGALAARALEAGKHVTSEVPAAHTIEDCWRIVLATERTGKCYLLAEQARYWSFVKEWRDLVATNELGKICYCEGQYIGYYGTKQFFQDFKTGKQYPVEELKDHPEAEPTVFTTMPPIHYLPHELSPMLKVLDDRVIQVVGMGTDPPSNSHPEVGQPDIQVALMKTEKGTVLRMAVGFAMRGPTKDDHHWYQLMGTHGRVEWRRRPSDNPRMWQAKGDHEEMMDMNWKMEDPAAPDAAKGSGHGDADYYVQRAFRDCLLDGIMPEIDVYTAMDTAAPAILAADSIEQGSIPFDVPDFRPGPTRKSGETPEGFVL